MTDQAAAWQLEHRHQGEWSALATDGTRVFAAGHRLDRIEADGTLVAGPELRHGATRVVAPSGKNWLVIAQPTGRLVRVDTDDWQVHPLGLPEVDTPLALGLVASSGVSLIVPGSGLWSLSEDGWTFALTRDDKRLLDVSPPSGEYALVKDARDSAIRHLESDTLIPAAFPQVGLNWASNLGHLAVASSNGELSVFNDGGARLQHVTLTADVLAMAFGRLEQRVVLWLALRSRTDAVSVFELDIESGAGRSAYHTTAALSEDDECCLLHLPATSRLYLLAGSELLSLTCSS
jgi:hypothetical protein